MTIKPAIVALSSLAGAPAVLAVSGAAESVPQYVTFSIFSALFFAFLGYLAKESKSQRDSRSAEKASDLDERRRMRESIDLLTSVMVQQMTVTDDALQTMVDVRETDDTADRERAVSGYYRRAMTARNRLAEQIALSTDTQEIPNATQSSGRRSSPAD
ncbi:MAG: hypothetical protein AAGM22_23655 [Acidobacteriota bacterium]